jgi:hypothetical protein
MLAWQVLADGARRELPYLDLSRRGAWGSDWRGVGEEAGRRTEKKPGVETRLLYFISKQFRDTLMVARKTL